MKKGNKNRKRNQKNVSYNSDNQLMSLFKIIGVLVIVFGLFYGITIWRTRDTGALDDNTTAVTIQYDEILIGTLLKQEVDEYYVLVADLNGIDYSKYDVYVSMFDSQKTRIYVSDIKNVFNQSYVGDNGNVSNYIGKTSIDGIVFDDVTLLHINKATNKKKEKITKITEVFVGSDNVLAAFKKVIG